MHVSSVWQLTKAKISFACYFLIPSILLGIRRWRGMMVSSKGRYALRVMLYLAQNDREELVPLKEIAESQNISMNYL